jgi:hypothetical protein
MVSTPVQVLHGLYLGLLAGIIPALVAFGFGFLFRYVTGLSIPAFGVVVLGVALAGVNGGLLAFADPQITQAANAPTLVTALLLVALLTFYSHAMGDRLGAELPRRISLKSIRERTLNADVVSFVGGNRQVTVRVVGAVRDLEGYPPLPHDVRASIRDVDWQFPADLPLSELETRFEDRLRTEFDVQEASVTIDAQARASVTAAPPAAGISKRTPLGTRAVSVNALVPTGVASGDEVTVITDDGRVEGQVLSARSGTREAPPETPTEAHESGADGATEAESRTAAPAPTTTGGEGRVTVAVSRPEAETLLSASEARVVVRARGTHREYELLALLRRGGQRVRRLTLADGSPVVDTTIGEANVRGEYDAVVLAVRHQGDWTIAPRGETALSAGDDVFVAGSRRALDRFEEVVA